MPTRPHEIITPCGERTYKTEVSKTSHSFKPRDQRCLRHLLKALTMKTIAKPLLFLTTSDLMNRDVIIIPQDMSLCAAARLLFQNQIGGAPVADANGRCVGMLSASDFVHWVEDGAIGAEDVPLSACPYQVGSRMLTGEDALTCNLAEGSCALQEMRPSSGGRQVAICLQHDGASLDWQQVTKNVSASAVRRYMTTDVVTARPETSLPELARTMIDAHIHPGQSHLIPHKKAKNGLARFVVPACLQALLLDAAFGRFVLPQ